MNWALANADYLALLTWRHVYLSAIPIALGFLLALPAGWLAYSVKPVRGLILGAGSLLYTIPSLPLFVILPTLLGQGYLSAINAVVALTIYAFAIMVRSVADALDSVPSDVLNAAEACGYSSTQRALRVTLPLAGPVMLASLRVVAVSTVSLLSIAALIGISNLGSLFTDGFQRSFIDEIIIGIVLIIAVAFIFDRLIVLAGRLLLPWTAKAGARA
ncbi:osmoprotectant transport system permease protein [Bowdeniella nasicola]|uniref:Osmoprotectant transport system permease protein n=1 Tax=Bowdeniella nasicola TaxID=208480 RepID=A0A1H3W883_9ACTO|nr:ABC transporter permease subunit [Bowdeniella nasicola]SDZ83287.1 osmoprotectant transport system permease protein [Bowdeniella nasicola]